MESLSKSAQKRRRERLDQLPYELNNFRQAMMRAENDMHSVYQFMSKIPASYSDKDVPGADPNVLNGRLDLAHLCNNLTALCRVIIDGGLGANLHDRDVSPAAADVRLVSTRELLKQFSPYEIAERFDVVRRAFKLFRIKNYHVLVQYEGISQNWNASNQLFMTELHCLFVRHRLFEQFGGKLLKPGGDSPEAEFVRDHYTDMITKECLRRLQNKQQLLCFGPKLITYYSRDENPVGQCLSQRELKLELRTLASQWLCSEYTEDMRVLVNLLLYETMYMLVVPSPDRLDGREGPKFDHVEHRQCTLEYCSTVLTQLTYFERSLYIAKLLRNRSKHSFVDN